MSDPAKRGTSRGGEPGDDRIPAAMYVRMSTEHQQYSTENQADAIRQYADRHGFRIVETFADEGKSGLSIEGRESLRRDHGKKMVPGSGRHRPAATAETLVKNIEEQAARQRMFVKKARRCENLLRVAVAALKTVLANEHFVTLLRAEGLLSLPRLAGTEAPWSADPRFQQETA